MAMLARDFRPARAFRDAAASDLNNFEIGPAFDQGSRRDVVHQGISLSKIRIHLDLIPSRTKSLVDEGAAFLMEPAALQQAAVHSGPSSLHVRDSSFAAPMQAMAPPSPGSHQIGFEVGGFASGKSYATDVAEMVARSQAVMHPSHHRGLPPQPNYAQPSMPPGAGFANGPWVQDDEWHAGAEQQFPHQLQPREPQHSYPQNGSVSPLKQPSYIQQPSLGRHPMQNHIRGVAPDADASTVPQPGQGKKAWEVEVERLRLAMQRHSPHTSGHPVRVSGPSMLPPSATASREANGQGSAAASNVASKPRSASSAVDKSKKTSYQQPDKIKPAAGPGHADKQSDANKKLTGQDKFRMEKMKNRSGAQTAAPVGGSRSDEGDDASVMLSAPPSSNDAPGEIRGMPHPLAKFMNAAGLVTLETFPAQTPTFARISPFLILGDFHTSASLETLQAENVVAVVNATTEVACHFPQHLFYLRVPVHDDLQEDLYPHFSASLGFINDYCRRGVILVHCLAGRCRSATIVLAHMVACGRLTLLQALTQLHEMKPDIRPNAVFSQQLLRLEFEVHGKYSMSFVGSKLVPI